MSDVQTLKAQPRATVGKGPARQARAQGLVPAVIYGGNEPPTAITLPYKDVHQRIYAGHFLTTIFDVDIDGQTTRVIPRDYQLDPVRDFPVHVDFLRLVEGSTVTVDIAVHFLNQEQSPGIKRGGALNVVRHAVEVVCPADSIPDAFEVDLAGLEIGASVHISAVTLPEGVKLTITDRDFTIATIAAPAGMNENLEGPAAPAEGEADAAEPEDS